MSTVSEHYDKVLSDFYSWMLGGFENAIERNIEFIKLHQLTPKRSGVAIDLGAGCGFQSIPLAQAGYSVTAIDLDTKLLSQLKNNCGDLPINIVQNNLVDFDKFSPENAELIVCMTDTIIHLESEEQVISVFNKAFKTLDSGGKFILTFRDLTYELKELDRFLPVRSDENTIFTCFLEYEQDTVKVHDIIYKKTIGGWELNKSFYRKLRLSKSWVVKHLSNAKFSKIDTSIDNNGFITVIANK